MIDKIVVFCCFSLLAVGIILGINFDINSTTLGSLDKVFSIIASIATLLMALIATFALFTWKHQFSHAERFKTFKELEKIALECIGTTEKYLGVFKDEYFPVNAPSNYKDHSKAKSEVLDTFWGAKCRYQIAVDFAQSLLTVDEQKTFIYSYSYFDTQIHEILNGITISYDDLEGEERHQSLLKVERNILKLKIDMKANLRQIRGQ